jgi:hypothetical protein
LSLNKDEVELDFEVIKEPWNKYNLMDGSNLKTKTVLMKVSRRTPEQGKPSYNIRSKNLVTAYNVPDNLKGPPAKGPVPPQDLKSVKKQEVGFSTLYEGWAEYLVEDGTRIRIKSSLMEVFRTERTNADGEPIYIMGNSLNVIIKPPKSQMTP